MNRNRLIPLHGIVLAALLMGGCKGGVTPIKTLLDDPGRFDKQTVRIAGNVEEAAGALGYGAYRLNDGTGTLTVITKSSGAPRTGARVGAEGEFRSAFTLGDQSVAVLMESSRYTP
jgi:hypothetical protein